MDAKSIAKLLSQAQSPFFQKGFSAAQAQTYTHSNTSPPYLACFFLSPWSKESLILAFTIVRGRLDSEPECQTLSFAHLSPYKSYTGAVYNCVSHLAPSDVLNLILKAWFTQFRGRFNLGSQNLQQKNAGAYPQSFSSFFSLFGGQRESFLMILPQEACPWIFQPIRVITGVASAYHFMACLRRSCSK